MLLVIAEVSRGLHERLQCMWRTLPWFEALSFHVRVDKTPVGIQCCQTYTAIALALVECSYFRSRRKAIGHELSRISRSTGTMEPPS